MSDIHGLVTRLIRILGILSSVVLIVSCFDTRLFNVHPIMMSASYLMIMNEGIIVARELSRRPRDRQQILNRHMIFQVLSLLAGSAGIGAIFANKMINNRLHFTTWHARFGLATFVSSAVVVIAGALLHWRLLTPMLGAFLDKRTAARIVGLARRTHRIAGPITFVGSLATFVLALRSNYFQGLVARAGFPLDTIVTVLLALMCIMSLVGLAAPAQPPSSSNSPAVRSDPFKG